MLVQDSRLGVADVQIARGLGRKAGDDLAVLGVLQAELEGRVGGAGSLKRQTVSLCRQRTFALPRWARSAWAAL